MICDFSLVSFNIYFLIYALLIVLGFFSPLIVSYVMYKSSSYYKITKKPYFSVRNDTGTFGEYLTYRCLRFFEKRGGRFAANVYVPKENDETTEMDLILVCSKGIFVFESKNYSGWIFGDEDKYKWTQTLPAGRGRSHKEYFYNPVMQNKNHIKYLKQLLGDNIPMWSIVVFSQRCTLKSIKTDGKSAVIVKRNNLKGSILSIYNANNDCLSSDDIKNITDKLYERSCVSNELRAQHINNINKNITPKKTAAISKNTQNEDDRNAGTVAAESKMTETNTAGKGSAATDCADVMSKKAPVEKAQPEKECGGQCSQPDYSTGKCPRCGGDMVLRTAKRGENAGKQFYGCSNYPKCRYIDKAD